MNRKATMLVAGVFVLGMVLGTLLMYAAEVTVLGSPRKMQDRQAKVLQHLTEELSLTAEQQQQISTILDSTRKRYEEIYEPIRPQMEQVRQEGREQIRKILTAEQLPRFEEYLRQMDERRRSAGSR